MNRIIIDFMSQQTCMTVCCLDANGLPYCFNCYFIYDNLHMRLIYKSSASAEHSKHIANNGHVSGTILPNHIRKFAVKEFSFWRNRSIRRSGGKICSRIILWKISYSKSNEWSVKFHND